MKESVARKCEHLNLSPYQTYLITQNHEKYDIDKLVKRGNVLYAPYRRNHSRGFVDACLKILHGPRADLIGNEQMLVQDKRSIKIYGPGFHTVYDKGKKYYADYNGRRLAREVFFKVI